LDAVSLSQLKIFRDIAQAKSVSRAAELNHVSQSAASQSLKSLERQVHLDLVDRRRRPLRLTPAGEICFEAARDLVRRYEQMEAQLESLREELEGSLRVVSIYSIGLYELTQLREEFQRLHPRTKVHLEFARPEDVYRAVVEDRADLGLVSYASATREIETTDWRRERMVLVCHPKDRLASQKKVHPADLAREDFISFDPGLKIRHAIDRFLRAHGVHREVAYEFDNIQMIKEALSLGHGVSILPERTVRKETADGRLVALPIEPEVPERPVGIVQRRKKRLSRTAEEFLGFLKQHAEP